MCVRWWKLQKIHQAFYVQCDTGMERELDLLVKESTRHRVAISGIQETKWFESDIWLTMNGRFTFWLDSTWMVMLPPGGRVLVFCWMVQQQPHGGLLERHHS